MGIPSEEIPQHFKPGKALKAEVMEIKKQRKAQIEAAKNTDGAGAADRSLVEADKPKPVLKNSTLQEVI